MSSERQEPTAEGPRPDQAAEGPRPDQVELARVVNRLGQAIVSRPVDPDQARALTEAVQRLVDDIEQVPEVSKADRVSASDRITTFFETGRWPEPAPDGEPLNFDTGSFVGGMANPFSMGTVYVGRDGESVGRVTFGPGHEGPPDRVHGGAICSVFDEVMGTVFRVLGTASAFTGELAVRFEAPAPLGTELEFRARLVGSDGRKQFLEGEGYGPDGRFATATGVFIQMTEAYFRDRPSR